MKTSFAASVVILAIAACAAPEKGLRGSGIEFFPGSYSEALQKATAEDKLVFVDVYTDWCGPCKLMDLNVFTDPVVGDYYNRHFVCIKRNQEAEVFDGPELTGRNEVSVLPTYLFIGPDGEHVHRGSGYFEPKAFVKFGEEALGGTTDTFDVLKARYEAGERDRTLVQTYLAESIPRPLTSARTREGWLYRHEMRQVFEEYLAAGGLRDLVNRDDFSLLAHFLQDAGWDDPLVEFVAGNYEPFASVAPESQVAFVLLESIKRSVGEAASKGDSSYARFIEELDGSLKPAYKVQVEVLQNDYLFKEYLVKLGDRSYQRTQQDWAAVDERSQQEIEAKGDAVAAADYLRAARNLTPCPDKEWLRRALEFSRRAFEMEVSPETALTYMGLLEALEEYDELTEVGERALSQLDAGEVDPVFLFFIERMLLKREFGADN